MWLGYTGDPNEAWSQGAPIGDLSSIENIVDSPSSDFMRGDLDRSSIQRGLRFLLGSQKPDGSWDEPQITGTGFPGVFYLKYDMYRQNFPLLALATYVNYRSGVGHRSSFYRCRAN